MLTLYTSPSCSSCRKVKKFFVQNKIQYREVNILTYPLQKEDVMDILLYAENGIEDIVSNRSKYILDNNIDLETMTMTQVTKMILSQPSVLKRPMILDKGHGNIQIGYNKDDIELYLRRN